MRIKICQLAAMLIIPLLVISNPITGQEKPQKTKVSKIKRGETIQLFNGKNLDNWSFKLKDQSIDPSTVFRVQSGIIHITGNPFGYMRTKEIYSDYILHVEWRWPSEATNSGVFVHGQSPDTIWLKCIECQLMAGSAGDFVCMNGADMNERTDKSKKSVKKLAPSNEKPVGDWNVLEVVCKSNTIDVSVNGLIQNKATGVNISSGYICLQSEGRDVEFRNVFLTKLKK